ncbi:DNA repair exonuclease [Campylobacter phage NCTC12673]|uniref:Calcineurin-like phosphoesterase domain-containing protein n=2 Tax=Fletchervirus NCTC12673 TaxID=934027 RepID=A0A1B0XW93_9CAUD|nr:DNA repair exonuclease [Campylobacter phage NCTC12673]YP_009321718.1 DNA repair exonuclease [Campylobacter phage PC14]AEA86408.1 hypothetical protein [Campylobacter phage NCTC12673]ANH51411.1 hypothetical protein PC14_00118 [Campylobacter phage PC14]
MNTSTLYNDKGKVVLQWVKNVPKSIPSEEVIESIKLASKKFKKYSLKNVSKLKSLNTNSLTLYNISDMHFGMLALKEETSDSDWNLDIASKTLDKLSTELISGADNTEECIICNLGDLIDINDFTHKTPRSGNVLDVDKKFPQILSVAYNSIINMIYKALGKHKYVYYINIPGNHDILPSMAVQYIIKEHFAGNKRVICDESLMNIKYHSFGNVLMAFTHGDNIKMKDVGQIIAFDNKENFVHSKHVYAYFGHYHVDKVIDTPLCRCESFRNLAPLNKWASNSGFRRGIGTISSITIHKSYGEISRRTYNMDMVNGN